MNFMLLVARAISHSFAALTREILFLPLEHKIHIFSLPCNILYVILVAVTSEDVCWSIRNVKFINVLQHALSRYVYNRSLCVIFN